VSESKPDNRSARAMVSEPVQPVFINKVLLEHHHNNLFTYFP
jgi:hypothetical protein